MMFGNGVFLNVKRLTEDLKARATVLFDDTPPPPDYSVFLGGEEESRRHREAEKRWARAERREELALLKAERNRRAFFARS
jgi:hypothetical protein